MAEPLHGPPDWPPPARRNGLRLLLVFAVIVGGPWAAKKIVALDDTGSDETKVVDVVRQFVEARRDGDCERLVGLVAETSWSADGTTRDEFVDRCDEAVAGYEPMELSDESAGLDELSEYDVVVRHDRAAVNPPAEMDAGRLVREGFGWRIVLDGGTFRLGHTPYQAIDAYLDAYSGGDCDALVELVTGGQEDERREACEAEMDDRVGAPIVERIADPDAEPDPVDDVSEVDIDLQLRVGGTMGTAEYGEGFQEQVHLVEHGFGWRIDGGHGPGDPLLVVDAARLATKLLREVEAPGVLIAGSPIVYDILEAGYFDASFYDDEAHDDLAGALRSDGFLYGAGQGFSTGAYGGVGVQLRHFSSLDGADRSARRQVDLHLANDGYPPARRVTPTVEGADMVAGYVTESTWAGDGVADPDIESIYLVAVRDGIVVSVNASFDEGIPPSPGRDDDLDQAVAILQAQLDLL